LLSSWIDYIKGIGDALYTEDASKIKYIKSTSNGVCAENTNKIIYIEFAGYRCLVLLIAEYRSIYILSKIGAG
jgi:hypothetical protein